MHRVDLFQLKRSVLLRNFYVVCVCVRVQIQVIHKCGRRPHNTTWRFVCDLRAAGLRRVAYMVAPFHTDWPATLAAEIIKVTYAPLAARYAALLRLSKPQECSSLFSHT